jgi:hypothetical protein
MSESFFGIWQDLACELPTQAALQADMTDMYFLGFLAMPGTPRVFRMGFPTESSAQVVSLGKISAPGAYQSFCSWA